MVGVDLVQEGIIHHSGSFEINFWCNYSLLFSVTLTDFFSFRITFSLELY